MFQTIIDITSKAIETLDPWQLALLFGAIPIMVIRMLGPALSKMVHRPGEDIDWDLNSPSVSILVPAYNEAPVIIDSVSSLLKLDYTDHEVIVVNDASTDGTLESLIYSFKLKPDFSRKPQACLSATDIHHIYKSTIFPNLTVIDKKRSGKGKADALNVGLQFATNSYICTVDADSVLDHDALKKIMTPFIKDPSTVAVGGSIRPGNLSKPHQLTSHQPTFVRSLLINAQILEYHIIFHITKPLQSLFRTLFCISGAFGAFPKDKLLAVGGYRDHALTEDIDLTLRLHMHCTERGIPYKISHASDAICWTEAPYTWQQFFRQRVRWDAGGLRALLDYRHALFNPSYGWVGLLVLPILLWYVVGIGLYFLWLYLALALPAQMSLTSSIVLGVIGWLMATGWYGMAVGYAEHHQKKPIWKQHLYAILMAPLSMLLVSVVGLAAGLVGRFKVLRPQKALHWGEMTRAGFTASIPTVVPPSLSAHRQ